MRTILACLVAAIGLAPAGNARAYQAIGPGVASCGTWTADRRMPHSSIAHIDESWVLGFLSALGWRAENGDDPLRGLDSNAVAGWIDNYCQAHPLDDIATATIKFYGAHPH
jgi:hypothetical protein